MILFVDIETVAEYQHLALAPDVVVNLWIKFWTARHPENNLSESDLAEAYQKNAAFYAEFARIACISLGYELSGETSLKSHTGEDERSLLEQANMVFSNQRMQTFCAHNGNNFDFPFIARRLLINRLPIPQKLQTVDVKPWDCRLIDTMNMWSLTQWRHNVSLDLLCHVLKIESPKSDIDGSHIHNLFHEQKDFKTISDYCESDVQATIRLYHYLENLKA